MKLKTKLVFLCVCSAVSYQQTNAATCCGGGFAQPSIIAGDEAAQLTFTTSYSDVIEQVGADSFWNRDALEESSGTFQLEGALILEDRWQLGAQLPLVRRSKKESTSTGLGDVQLLGAYEYLPDWNYNPWRPKGIVYIQLTVPTGVSNLESTEQLQTDSFGRGFWTLGLGTLLTKSIDHWDVFANLEFHHSFARDFENNSVRGTLDPGWGFRSSFGGGYNLGDFRLGTSLAWSVEDPVDTLGTIESSGTVQRFVTASLSGSYLVNQSWAVTIAYNDQTWFGDPINTALSRGVSLSVQKRWAR